MNDLNSGSQMKIKRRSFISGITAASAITSFGQQRDYGPGAAPVRYPDPDILVLDKRFGKYKNRQHSDPKAAYGNVMGGGPAWNSVGRYLVWSDIPNNVQHRWLEEDGHVSTFRNPANNSNGNTFDWEGRQISCEHATRRVVRYEHNGTATVLAEKWQGKPFNAPMMWSSIPTAVFGSPIPGTAAWQRTKATKVSCLLRKPFIE
jgi:gluconolactonase